MKFLADESVDFGTVRALRSVGFDVLAVAELAPGIPDQQVAADAYRDSRILLTEDKDFGQLVYATGALAHGVIFVRFPANLRTEMIASVVEVIQRLGDRLAGQFVVLQPGKVRLSQLRSGD